MERKLRDPVVTFRGMFGALGFEISDETAWCFNAVKQDGCFRVWAPPLDPSSPLSVDAARAEILRALDEPPLRRDEQRLVLLPNLLALRADFQTDSRGRGAMIRAYNQLLDDDYKTQNDNAEPVLLKRGAEAWRRRREVQGAREKLSSQALRWLPERLLAEFTDIDPAMRAAPGRVRQSYRAIRLAPGVAGRFTGDDLLEDLATHLRVDMAVKPEIILITGQAGVGKSQLFDALYVYLSRYFGELKNRQRVAARPVRFVPEDLARAPSYSSASLFAAVAEAPEAAMGQVGLMDWRLREGLMVLMFDGLDEFFAAQDDFFKEIRARYFAKGSGAKIIICLRDSLLATSSQVRGLVEDLEVSEGVRLTMLEVTPWRDDCARLREFAWSRLERRAPSGDETDTPAVAGLLDSLDRAPALREVVALPFFLEAIVRYRREGDGAELAVTEILRRLVADIIAREWRKLEAVSPASRAPQSAFARASDGSIRFNTDLALWLKTRPFVQAIEQVFGAAPVTTEQNHEIDALFDEFSAVEGRESFVCLIEDVAFAARRGGSGRGVTRERLIELYGRERPADIAPELRRRGELMLRQFALFGAVGDDIVDFNHVIVADYLAARAAARRLLADPAHMSDALGRAPSDETDIFQRVLEEELREHPSLLRDLRRMAGKTASG